VRIRTALVAATVLALLALPTAGASFTNPTSNDANSWQSRSPIRTTTYQIPSAVFTGTTYDLTLAQDLADDYFVIMRGGAGANDSTTARDPDQDYARVTRDPHGNLSDDTSASNVLRLGRETASSDWQGQVTVIESLDSQTTDGFTLLDVVEPSMVADDLSETATISTAWSDIDDVGLYGGINGGGVSTTSSTPKDHITAWGRIYPSSTATVNVERLDPANGNGALSGTTDFTIYAIEWGSNWTIQRVTVTGSNSGTGVNATSEYNTATITQVNRDETFVTASGTTETNRLQNGWEGHVVTLGDGVNQNSTETSVAVGAEGSGYREAEVYIHEHANLAVDYRFGTDGSIASGELTDTQTVDSALGPETYTGGTVSRTEGYRLPYFTNSQDGNTTNYPRSLMWARHTADTTVTWTRSRSGEAGAYWLQSVDFSEIWR
jgi:hypothetical protein